MILEEYKTAKEKVKYLLEHHPATRDNDNILCTVYWRFEIGKEMSNVDVVQLLSMVNNKTATAQSTILRCRRKVNQEHPHTRGESYRLRKENEAIIRENINK
jgi:hypothetical protein